MGADPKAPGAFRTITEVASWLGVEAHVLRFWETKFNQIRPVKRAGGRRYYRASDMELLDGIRVLLHDRGMTIKGVQKMIRDEGVALVAEMGRSVDGSREPAPVLLPKPSRPVLVAVPDAEEVAPPPAEASAPVAARSGSRRRTRRFDPAVARRVLKGLLALRERMDA